MQTTSFNIIEPSINQASYNYTMNDLMVYFTNTSSVGANSWDFGDGTTSSSSNPFHSYSTNGTYNACLSLTTSCGVVTYCEDITVFDSSTIDIKEITSDMIKVFPNPSKGIFNINLRTEKDISINVFDITGRLVYFKDFINSKELMVNISDKLPGTYILKILIDEVQYQKRIINTK
ncbi:MAG: Protease 1 [Crocinitomicaceae bacterium]|nr:MAG: Protease 1 [Crocinitomicaceae bacterium]